LKEETGTEDMDLIVKKLVDCEEENFSLFKYINSLRDEQEVLIE
jgi:intein-encoded DNA endonuclease-like protein